MLFRPTLAHFFSVYSILMIFSSAVKNFWKSSSNQFIIKKKNFCSCCLYDLRNKMLLIFFISLSIHSDLIGTCLCVTFLCQFSQQLITPVINWLLYEVIVDTENTVFESNNVYVYNIASSVQRWYRITSYCCVPYYSC